MASERRKQISLVAFGFIGSLCAFLAEIHFVQRFRESKTIEKWPSQPGEITRSEIRSKGIPVGNSFWAEISYVYEIEGQRKTGSSVRPRGTSSSYQRSAEAWVKKYPVGASVTVFVNPDDSTEAYLESGPDKLSYFLIIMPAVGCFVFLGLGIEALKALKGQNGKLTNPAFAVRILKDLRTLPQEITVTHNPNPVGAELGGISGYEYTWLFETKVSGNDIEIEQYGCFNRVDGKWIFLTVTGEPFDVDVFAEAFDCPDGILEPGVEYSDPTNWNGGDQLSSTKCLWYFIGRKRNGQKVQGHAVLRLMPQVG